MQCHVGSELRQRCADVGQLFRCVQKQNLDQPTLPLYALDVGLDGTDRWINRANVLEEKRPVIDFIRELNAEAVAPTTGA